MDGWADAETMDGVCVDEQRVGELKDNPSEGRRRRGTEVFDRLGKGGVGGLEWMGWEVFLEYFKNEANIWRVFWSISKTERISGEYFWSISKRSEYLASIFLVFQKRSEYFFSIFLV